MFSWEKFRCWPSCECQVMCTSHLNIIAEQIHPLMPMAPWIEFGSDRSRHWHRTSGGLLGIPTRVLGVRLGTVQIWTDTSNGTWNSVLVLKATFFQYFTLCVPGQTGIIIQAGSLISTLPSFTANHTLSVFCWNIFLFTVYASIPFTLS